MAKSVPRLRGDEPPWEGVATQFPTCVGMNHASAGNMQTVMFPGTRQGKQR